MNEVGVMQVFEPNTAQTMTSMQIAEITGKKHSNVLRDIRTLLEQGVREFNFELSFQEQAMPNGGTKKIEYYNLTKNGCLILASGYNAKLREAIIDRWEVLEQEKAQKEALERRYEPQPQFLIPQNYAEALQLAANQQFQLMAQDKQLEEQKQQIQEQETKLLAQSSEIEELTDTVTELNGAVAEMKVKVSYVDRILRSPDTVKISVIAQDYGMSAIKFNLLLKEKKIQHKVGAVWIINAKYVGENYVKDVPFIYQGKTDPRDHVKNNTQWTQKGRLWLYEKLKADGILPLEEQPQPSLF